MCVGVVGRMRAPMAPIFLLTLEFDYELSSVTFIGHIKIYKLAMKCIYWWLLNTKVLAPTFPRLLRITVFDYFYVN